MEAGGVTEGLLNPNVSLNGFKKKKGNVVSIDLNPNYFGCYMQGGKRLADNICLSNVTINIQH